jgi:uncharacterized protein YecE (DUF72 family)
MSEIRIGISGWTYAPWQGVFYPKKLPHHEDLAYASRQLNTIEINGSFYSLQKPASYRKWFDATPDDFIFTVKANRYITHTLRLDAIERPVANFLGSGILALEHKLGPILWQFPPSFKYDREKLENFLELLPHTHKDAAKYADKNQDSWMKKRSFLEGTKQVLRHAIEVRNESFRNPEFYRLLKKHDVSLVISHSPSHSPSQSKGAWPYFEELTSDFVYARLHGEGEIYSGGYGTRAIKQWAKKINNWTATGGKTGKKKSLDVFFYFDNDVKVKAPFDAMALAKKVGFHNDMQVDASTEIFKKAA